MARKNSRLIEHVLFKLEAGQEPAVDRAGARGGRALRDWQAAGFKELRGHAFRMLISPTASGKSTLIKALGCDDLSTNHRLRVVVAVPQSLIARSFGDDVLELEERTLEWAVAKGNDLTKATTHTVAALVRFLSAPPATDAAGRVMLCTHQTLVMAHKRLMSSRKGKVSPWKDVSLYVDEAHHSKSDEGAGAENANNRLGELVEHWLDEKPGPLLLATATMMRGDLLDIVPSGRLDAFTKCVRSMEEHLRSMKYLKEVSFRFLIGKPEDALAALYREGNKKTIAWLPHVASRHIRGAGTTKTKTLDRYQGAVGSVVGVDEWTTVLRTNGRPARTVRVLDFVDPEGREARKTKLEEAIPRGPKHTPDLLWALGLGKEGFDWPELERAVIIGDRGSLTDIHQMQGRVLRDHPGKTSADIIVLLPWEGDAEPDASAVKGYIQTIIASMVIEWQFKHRRTRRSKAGTSIVDDPRKAAETLCAVVDAVIRDPRVDEHQDDIIRKALGKAGVPADDGTVEDVRSLLSNNARAMARQSKDLPSAVEVTESVFDGIRMLAAKFGHKSLAALREALGIRTNPLPEDELRPMIAGMSQAHYETSRALMGDMCPHVASFRNIYGKTFAELRDGTRGDIHYNRHVDEATMRDRIQGLEVKDYVAARASFGAGYGPPNEFRKIYGKSFRELRDGQTNGHAISEAAMRDTIRNMTITEYHERRAKLGLGYPHATRFQDVYGKSFQELRDGHRKGDFATESEALKVIAGKTAREYDAWRIGHPCRTPASCAFQDVYGKTFKEMRDGNRRGEFVSVDVFVENTRRMSRIQYERARSTLGPRFPSCSAIRKVYGATFAQLHARVHAKRS